MTPTAENQIQSIVYALLDRRDSSLEMRQDDSRKPLQGFPVSNDWATYYEGAEDMAASLISTLIGDIGMADVKEIMNIGDHTLAAEVMVNLLEVIRRKEAPIPGVPQ